MKKLMIALVAVLAVTVVTRYSLAKEDTQKINGVLIDAKCGKGSALPLGRAGDDIIAPEQIHFVRRERRYGQKLQNRRLKPGNFERNRQERPLLAGNCEHEFH